MSIKIDLYDIPHIFYKKYSTPTVFGRWLDIISKVKLATEVEGDQKAPFSLATTPRWRGRLYSFSWIAPLYPWYVPYFAECRAKKYQVPFLMSLVSPDVGLNPGLEEHWRTLYPLGQWIGPATSILKNIWFLNFQHLGNDWYRC